MFDALGLISSFPFEPLEFLESRDPVCLPPTLNVLIGLVLALVTSIQGKKLYVRQYGSYEGLQEPKTADWLIFHVDEDHPDGDAPLLHVEHSQLVVIQPKDHFWAVGLKLVHL